MSITQMMCLIVMKRLLYRASPDRSSSLRTVMAQKAQKTGLPYSSPAASQEITETTCHWGVTNKVVFM